MNTTKVEMKNEDGKLIIKDVPNELLSLYLSIGWKKSEPKSTYSPKIDNSEK